MDEGKFFSDLESQFHQNPEAYGPIQGVENVGLEETDTSQVIENLSSDGNSSIDDRSMQHPVRLDAENCSFYIRTGTCKFGRTCRFNHPVSKDLSRIPCKFYQTGFCKYGDSCRFNHSKSLLQLNILGYPERLGSRICSFYMRTGTCGYGTLCRFHHPDPIFITAESMDDDKEYSISTQPPVRLLKFGSI